MTLGKVINEIFIKLFPFDIDLRRRALANKYLHSLNIKGKNTVIKDDITIKRRTALILGDNVEIAGKNNITATAGILLGSNCKIDSGVHLNTVSNSKFDPIVIGAGHHVKTDVEPGTLLNAIIPIKGLSEYNGQLVFVLSTGRSGSKSIAKFLDQHEDAECYHDSFAHLNSWSCDYLYRTSSKEQIKKKLATLYNATSFGKKKVFGQSDQKIAPLISILAELFPNAKFVWLIRDPYDFINSAYARGWFDNEEFGYSINKDEFIPKKVTPSKFDAYHRCNGAKVGDFTLEEWTTMTAFERICWYWSFWNSLIERELNTLPKERYLTVKLEELESKKSDILEFLGLTPFNAKAEKINGAYYKKPFKSQWSSDMHTIFKKHCHQKMKEWGY